jgi:uncharacterized protein with PIN domain
MSKFIQIRFYEELSRYLPPEKRKTWFCFQLKEPTSINNLLESINVPSGEIDLLLVDGQSVNTEYILNGDEHLSVYPKFERFNIRGLTKVREVPLRTPKFICDSHLGKLCKYLRMLGFDTLFATNLNLREMIYISLEQKRIILSRNLRLINHPYVTRSYWVKSFDALQQTQCVIENLDLSGLIFPLSRCLICNGILVKTEKRKISNQLEEGTKKNFQEFYVCNSCNKIYWKGSHYQNMMAMLLKHFIKM